VKRKSVYWKMRRNDFLQEKNNEIWGIAEIIGRDRVAIFALSDCLITNFKISENFDGGNNDYGFI
jgi:hypothetical protein